MIEINISNNYSSTIELNDELINQGSLRANEFFITAEFAKTYEELTRYVCTFNFRRNDNVEINGLVATPVMRNSKWGWYYNISSKDITALDGDLHLTIKLNNLNEDEVITTTSFTLHVEHNAIGEEQVLINDAQYNAILDKFNKYYVSTKVDELLSYKVDKSTYDDSMNMIKYAIMNTAYYSAPNKDYASLSALQTAYPSGASGVYLTSDNGHWYYWNGTAWTDGGVYQTALNYDELEKRIDSISKYKEGNLISGYQFTIGYWNNGHSYASNYKYVAKVPVYAGKTYKIYPNSRFVSIYSLNGTHIETKGEGTKSFSTTVDGYVYITYYGYDLDKNCKLYDGSMFSDPNGVPDKDSQILNDEIEINELKEYKEELENEFAKNNILNEDFSEHLTNDIRIETGKNLCPSINNVVGALQNDGLLSTIASWGNYLTSPFIKIKKDQPYTISLFTPNGVPMNDRIVAILYDGFKNPITSTYINLLGNYYFTFIPEKDGYVRVSANKSLKKMVEIGSESTAYEEYYYRKYSKLLIDTSNIPYHDALYGKKWIPCGDSFTDYADEVFTDGIFAGRYKSYPRLISQRCGIEIDQNFFSSGRTLAYPADGSFTNSLTCPTNAGYYQNIPEDTDYVTIMLGINDGHHRNASSSGDGEINTGIIPLGTINDTTTATYYGAWNVVITWLRTNRPFTHIGILVSNGVDSVDYRTAQLEIAKKYGVPYIDLNGDERTPAMIRSQNPDVSDDMKEILRINQAVDYDGSKTGSVNTHPNAKAHEFESWFIENFLRTL